MARHTNLAVVLIEGVAVRLVAVFLAVLVFVLVGGAPATAVVNGEPDGEAHPNVGLLAFDVDGEGETPPFALCTGVVISDSAFLTAAHCITAIPDAQWVVTLEGGDPANPVATSGYFPDDFPFVVTAPVYRSTSVVVHPDFVGGEARRNDLAVVLFPEGTFAGVTPVELPSLNLLATLNNAGGLHGDSVTLVGYGTDAELGPPRYLYPGYRQTGTAPIDGVTRNWLLIQGSTAATGESGLCYGDSGSPQFLGDTNLVLSIFSRHPTTCQGTVRGQRLDTTEAREFLAQFVDLP